jgi:hypothetical protein
MLYVKLKPEVRFRSALYNLAAALAQPAAWLSPVRYTNFGRETNSDSQATLALADGSCRVTVREPPG